MNTQAIKGYELHERIGTGGFGAVYRASQTTIGREVAVKIVLPTLANQPEFIRRFESEAQVVARLEHPHIVPLHDYWRDADGAYLVMRWLKGGSLRDALQNGPFDLRSAALMLDQISAALSLAHRSGIIHRDLKPGNILLDEDGNAYLSDFGIAKDLNLSHSHTQADTIVGSLDYISPEQARSEAITPRTDIYSLGVTLYEVISGHHPFEGFSSVERLYKHINDPMPEITTLDPTLAAAVNTVLQKATSKDPQYRYSEVLAFAADFREAAGLNRTPTTVVKLLTQREQDILHLIIEGLSNKEIAQRLTVTLGTVKWYVNQIYAKLGVRSRVQAMVRARELNLLTTLPDADAISVVTTDFNPENPYKGLHAFSAADYKNYFGREKLTDKLIKKLNETTEFTRFLAVVGPSGSGKSSLVKAGLIPAIWKGTLSGSEKWFVAEMLPGVRPLDELEVTLTKIAANHADRIREHLTRDKYGLSRVASMILPNDGSDLLLVIDQFEEIFTLVEDEQAREHFLDLIYTAVTTPRSRVRVVVTLRADFYDRPLHYPKFGELVRTRMETIMPLSADELERAIVKPAEQIGAKFEAGLVTTIVSEVKYQAGALPLLQYALTELFERRSGKTFTLEAYQAIGGTVGALAKRAEEIYADLDETGKEMARQMFLRLVTLGEGTEDTRRRVMRSELLAIATDADVMDEVIDAYAEYRLLSLDNDPATRAPTVEVAHEAILREWERLRAWLNESRDDVRLQRQLLALADEWHTAKQDASFLLRGSRLEMFEKWVKDTKLALTSSERVYLNASVAERERQAATEVERRKRETRLERRSITFLRTLVGVLLMATLGAFGLTGFAFGERNQAQANFALSEGQRLAAEANLLLQQGSRSEVAALLSINALHSAYSPQADLSLQRASQWQYGDLLFTASNDISAVAFTNDGNSIVTTLYNGTLQLRDAQTGDVIWEVTGFGGAPLIKVSPTGDYLLLSDENGVHLIDLRTGTELRQFNNPAAGAYILNAAFMPDGQSVIVFGGDYPWIADLETGAVIREFIEAGLSHVISSDGRYFATANIEENLVRIWDIEANQLLREFATAPLTGMLMFSPDNRFILTANMDNVPRLWDVETGEQIVEFRGHTEVIGNMTFSPDGRYLATGSMDTTARLWDVTTGAEIRRFTGHTSVIFTLTFSPEGRYLLTGSRDASVRLWDLQASPRYNVLSGTVGFSYGVVYSPDYSVIAAAFGRDIYLWNSASYELQQTFRVPQLVGVQGIRFSPDGNYLLAADVYEQTVYLFDIETRETVYVWAGGGYHASITFTPDGGQVLTSTPQGLFLWDVETGEQVRQFTEEVGNSYLTYSPDGRYLLTAGPVNFGSEAYLWDAETGEKLRTFTGHTKDINSLAFSPDGLYIMTGSSDSTAILWNVETGERIRTFVGHGARIWAVNFSSDGRTLLTGSMDGTARLWDVATGQELRRFVGQSLISAAIFSPDERFVLVGASDGNVYITPTRIEDLIASVCARVQRDLTALERSQFIVRNTEPTCPG